MSVGLLSVMFAAGLAGSLHCVGMCGPILIGLGELLARRDVGARSAARRALDLGCYHIGRIWTYALMGLVAGQVGVVAQRSGAHLGWQRPVGVVLAVAVIASGTLLLGVFPVRLDSARLDGGRGACWIARLRDSPVARVLTSGRGLLPRLLLGVVMGFLPCGLVYAMLVMAASAGGPVPGALGMIAFGAGTLPALSALQLVARRLPTSLRTHGTRVAAIAIVITGLLMLGRATLVAPVPHGCPACAQLD